MRDNTPLVLGALCLVAALVAAVPYVGGRWYGGGATNEAAPEEIPPGPYYPTTPGYWWAHTSDGAGGLGNVLWVAAVRPHPSKLGVLLVEVHERVCCRPGGGGFTVEVGPTYAAIVAAGNNPLPKPLSLYDLTDPAVRVETVETPTGSFRAVRVEHPDRTEWYARGVGPVRGVLPGGRGETALAARGVTSPAAGTGRE